MEIRDRNCSLSCVIITLQLLMYSHIRGNVWRKVVSNHTARKSCSSNKRAARVITQFCLRKPAVTLLDTRECKNFVPLTESIWRHMCKCEDNIRMDLRYVGWEGVECIHLIHGRVQRWVLVNTTTNLRGFHKERGISWPDEWLLACQEGLCFVGSVS
jgi:hypothetical protein